LRKSATLVPGSTKIGTDAVTGRTQSEFYEMLYEPTALKEQALFVVDLLMLCPGRSGGGGLACRGKLSGRFAND